MEKAFEEIVREAETRILQEKMEEDLEAMATLAALAQASDDV
jgi:hypothetical protein